MDLASKLYATRLGMTATSVEHPVDQDGGKTAAFPHRGFITMRQTGGEAKDRERGGGGLERDATAARPPFARRGAVSFAVIFRVLAAPHLWFFPPCQKTGP